MIKTAILSLLAYATIAWVIDMQNQWSMFTGDWVSPLFVLLGGTFIALSVSKERENLLIERLEAFRTGCILFGVIGTLTGLISMMASMDNPKMIGPALALALLTLFYAAVFNYVAKLVIISKSSGG